MESTLKSLVSGKPALEQYRIFQWADKNLPGGRYFGGLLSAQQVKEVIGESSQGTSQARVPQDSQGRDQR